MSGCSIKAASRHSMRAFTLLEVAVALVLISAIITSVLVVMQQVQRTMIDMRLKTIAFEIARHNLETLLSQASVTDTADFGFSELYPDIDWQTVVEPFYEPISNRLWIRGVCTAGFTDSDGQRQDVELSAWLTGLSAQQARQVLDQQKRKEEYLSQFAETDMGQWQSRQRDLTAQYIKDKLLDVDAYYEFLERQDFRRMDYIAENGYDKGYVDFVEQQAQEESDFLYQLGVKYNDYVAYLEKNRKYLEQGEQDSAEESLKEDVEAQPQELPADGQKDKPPTQKPKSEMDELKKALKGMGWDEKQINDFMNK